MKENRQISVGSALEDEDIEVELERVKVELKAAQATIEELNSSIKALENDRGIDFLTGLFNAHFLMPRLEKLVKELNNSSEERKSLPTKVGAVVFQIDLKGLKSFNKSGQGEGNRALVSFANLLRHTVRDHDLLFRVGGDEFVVILPIERGVAEIPIEEVFEIVIQRIKGAVGDVAYVGYSKTVRGDKKTASQLLKTADKEMTENKRKEKGE